MQDMVDGEQQADLVASEVAARPPMARNTDGCLDARADKNAFTTWREMYDRVWAKGPAGSTWCSVAFLFRQSPLHHTHKRDRRSLAKKNSNMYER